MARVEVAHEANSDPRTISLLPAEVEENSGGVLGAPSIYKYPGPLMDNPRCSCLNGHSRVRISLMKGIKLIGITDSLLQLSHS